MRILLACAVLLLFQLPRCASQCSRIVASSEAADSVNDWLAECDELSISWQGQAELFATIRVAAGKTLRIVGASAASPGRVDGNGLIQLFIVNKRGSLFLSDMVLSGGAPEEAYPPSWTSYQTDPSPFDMSGGCLHVAGTADVVRCAFEDCTAPLGGGAFVSGSAIIASSTFSRNTATQHGGGIYVYFDGAATVTNCSFTENTAIFGGGICNYFGQGTVEIADSLFTDNKATQGGGMHMYGGSTAISGCQFTGNEASNGGGVCFSFGEGRVESSDFRGNSAIFGGGLFVGTGTTASVASTAFVSNKASSNGGAVYTEANFTVTEAAFHSNTALEAGGAVAAAARTIFDGAVPAISARRSNFTANTAASDGGALWAGAVSVEANAFSDNSCDGLGGAIFSMSQVIDNGGSSFSGNSAGTAGGAIFMDDVDDWRWSNAATAFAGNSAQCCYRLPPADGAYSCADVSGHASGREACCGAGTLVVADLVSGGASECETCPDGFECPVGPWPTLQAGYWRAGGAPGFVSRECLRAAACRGGSAAPGTAPDSYCAEGYEGPYCAVCADGYSKGLGYDCNRCSNASKAGVVAAVAFIVLVVVGILWYVLTDLLNLGDGIRGATDGDDMLQETSALQAAAVLLRRVPWSKLRIPVVAWQIVCQYVAISGVVLPPLYADFVKVLTVINFDMSGILSLGCVVHLSFYERLLIATATPFAVAALLACSYAWMRYRAARLADRGRLKYPDVDAETKEHGDSGGGGSGSGGGGGGEGAPPQMAAFAAYGGDDRNSGVADLTELIERVQSKHAMIFLVFSFLIYSWTSTLIFQTFACDSFSDEEIPGGKSYLRADYSIECDGPKYAAYRAFAAVMVLVYPIGIPLLYAGLLWRQHRHLATEEDDGRRHADHHLRTTRFLWLPYKPTRHWWEVVECVRRLALTGFLVFIFPQSSGQAAVACVFAMISLAAIAIAAPYLDYSDLNLYVLGCMIIFFSTFLSLTIKVDVTAEEAQSQQVLSALLVVLNVAMLLAALVQCALVAHQARSFVSEQRSSLTAGEDFKTSRSKKSSAATALDSGELSASSPHNGTTVWRRARGRA